METRFRQFSTSTPSFFCYPSTRVSLSLRGLQQSGLFVQFCTTMCYNRPSCWITDKYGTLSLQPVIRCVNCDHFPVTSKSCDCQRGSTHTPSLDKVYQILQKVNLDRYAIIAYIPWWWLVEKKTSQCLADTSNTVCTVKLYPNCITCKRLRRAHQPVQAIFCSRERLLRLDDCDIGSVQNGLSMDLEPLHHIRRGDKSSYEVDVISDMHRMCRGLSPGTDRI